MTPKMPKKPQVPPLPVSASDMTFKQKADGATAYSSLVSNAGGAAGLSKPAFTAKKSLLGA